MRGRPPKPSTLRELEGNPGHRPINANEPKPESAMPSSPSHLKHEARREWNRIAPELMQLGLLTRIDRAALAAYCQTWGRWCEAELKVKEAGLVVKMKGGQVIPNPYLSVANAALKQLKAFATEFGLTPSSRSRLSVAPAGSAADEVEDFLADGAGPMRLAR
jgi:P27 family predicted phage terminase small subunit